VFRLAGQGMPRARGGFGDLLARVRITLPSDLTDEQRELLARLRDTSTTGEPPREPQHEAESTAESAAGAAS
ncbi:MAG: hypothetical protein O3C25_03810, partial [Chloroflexi bacterium]|nr:hypothetical protein [Chloroflexota bacterium]